MKYLDWRLYNKDHFQTRVTTLIRLFMALLKNFIKMVVAVKVDILKIFHSCGSYGTSLIWVVQNIE